MAYEDVYQDAKAAEQAALHEGKNANQAYAAWCAVIHQNIAERIQKQDVAHQAALRARLAADRLIYEGGLSVDDVRYQVACKIADDLGMVFHSL